VGHWLSARLAVPAMACFQPEAICSTAAVDAAIAIDDMDVANPNH